MTIAQVFIIAFTLLLLACAQDEVGGYYCECTAEYHGETCDFRCTTHEECPAFVGTGLMTDAQARALLAMLPAGKPWIKCFDSSTDGLSNATFHSQCDRFDETVVVVRHGPVPDGDGTWLQERSPRWVEGADWVFGGYASGSWSVEACCAANPDECHSTQECYVTSASDSFIYGLAPGRPQVFAPFNKQGSGEGSRYLRASTNRWPTFGEYDLVLGEFEPAYPIAEGEGGYCWQGNTYAGGENEACGGYFNWVRAFCLTSASPRRPD